MNRRIVALAVVLVWLVALGWLVRREVVRPTGGLFATAALNLPPSATYYRVSAGDAQVGFISTTIDTLPDTLRVTEVFVLEIPIRGRLQRTDAQTEATLTRDLELREFTAWLRGNAARFATRGVVSGDTLLTVSWETPDGTDTLRLPLTAPVALPSLLPLNVAFREDAFELGRTLTLRVFDPLLVSDRSVSLTVEAESTFVFPDSAAFDSSLMRFVPVTWDTVQAWAVRRDEIPAARMWIDRVGQVVLVTTPAGFRLERSVFEVAYENFRRAAETRRSGGGRPGEAREIVRQSTIAAGAPLPADGPDSFAVRLRSADPTVFEVAGDRQTLRGDTLLIVREAPTALRARYSLRRPPGNRFAPYMAPEPLIESADPRIEAQARQIVGRTRDPARAVEDLVAWVHGQLAKQTTPGLPSAVEALARRRGDVNEHTTLFTALARAVNIPARPVAGLLYVDGAFYYHAWTEVWLDAWVAVDPTLGQFPADAHHVRLAVGYLARPVELLHLLGRLSLEVVTPLSGA